MLVASPDRRQFSSSPHTINSNSINYIEEPLYYTTPSTPTHAIYHPQYTLPASPAPLDIHHISKLMHLSNQGQNIWNGQLTPASSRSRPQQSHNRDSSLSSIGSVGPASPFNSTSSTSHPLIVLESDTGAYYDGLPATYQNYSKPLTPLHTSSQESFAYGYQSYPQYNQLAAFIAMQKQQDDDSMPAPEYSHSTRISVASQDSPSTPPIGEDYKTGETEFLETCVTSGCLHSIEYKHSGSVPKLDRTMSDVYNDELYSPNFGYSSSTPTSKPVETTSPSHDIFSQRLQAANTQHLSATAQIPNLSRGRSPFRQGSPLAPTSDSFAGSQLRLGSAQQTRERRKAEGDAVAIAQQLNRASPVNITTPKTISPKDALLDYSESDEAAAMPLFPPLESTQRRRNVLVARDPSQSEMDETVSQQSFGSMATSRRESSDFSRSSQSTQQGSGFTFVPPAVPGVQIPQQYPFVPQPRREVSSMSSTTPDFPSTMTSQESSGSDYVPDLSTLRKPAGATADGGTYTCTYHGCSLRFETPAKLQKHKREGHRQSAPLSTTTAHSGQSNSPEATGMTSAALLRNSQAGPHKCERINPSTGKPCNTIFSRPYDLTRHEDTIHNARKQKVRCHLCTEEKTFSRNDALTRHMRVVHPEVDFPGKTKRRVHD